MVLMLELKPQTGAIYYHAPLVLPDEGLAIKELVETSEHIIG